MTKTMGVTGKERKYGTIQKYRENLFTECTVATKASEMWKGSGEKKKLINELKSDGGGVAECTIIIVNSIFSKKK